MSQVKCVPVGSSVKFSCDTTDIVNSRWDYFSTSYPAESLPVYDYPNVTGIFKWRHSVFGNSLYINNVQLCDAGKYRCSFVSGDNLGTNNFQLIVLGMYGYREPNNSNKQPMGCDA